MADTHKKTLEEELDQEEKPSSEQATDSEEETLRQAAAQANQQLDQETQELLARIQALEAQGREDQEITAQLANRGISRQAAAQAWQQHVQDFPEHEHEPTPTALKEANERLEERLADTPARQPTGNPLYDLQENLADASNEELYNALETAQTYIRDRGGVTDNEYQALNTFEEELNRRAGYDQSASATNRTVQEIRNLGKLRIGDSYLSNDNQRL